MHRFHNFFTHFYDNRQTFSITTFSNRDGNQKMVHSWHQKKNTGSLALLIRNKIQSVPNILGKEYGGKHFKEHPNNILILHGDDCVLNYTGSPLNLQDHLRYLRFLRNKFVIRLFRV